MRSKDLDLLDSWCMEGEDPLHTMAEGGLPDRHRGPRPTMLERDDHPLENLNPLFVALLDLHVYLYGISGFQSRYTLSQLS